VVPPQNIEAEESVLGAMLVAEPTLTRVIDEVKLDPADFYLDKHRLIFEVVRDLYAASKPVDELSVSDELGRRDRIDEAGGRHYVSELAAKVPAAANAKHYAEIVQEHARIRAKRTIGQHLQNGLAPDEAIEQLRELLEPGRGSRKLAARPLSEVAPSRTRWAWDERLPLGAVSLLAGRQGLGKSTLLAAIAADLSWGRLAGDLAGDPTTVLWVSYEDTFETTVVPRLIAAGADLERVVGLDVTDGGRPDLLSLPNDVDLVAEAAREYGAGVLFVDPLMAALPGRIDSHRDQDVRRALAPLAQLAEDLALSVLAVVHLRKGGATEALDRVSGSVAFTAAARSVLAFGRGSEEEQDGSRVLAAAKSNLGRLAPSLAYHLEPATVSHGDQEIPTSRLVLDGETDASAGDLLSPPAAEDRSEIEIACEWLADQLEGGEWRAMSDLQEAARREDVASWRTIHRARQRLGVEATRRAGEGDDRARGYWRLPVVPTPLAQQRLGDDGTTGSPLADAESAASADLSCQDPVPGTTGAEEGAR
jgi:hypothetical protein